MDTATAARHNHNTALGRRRRRHGAGSEVVRCSTSPAQEFAALASVFRRRLVVGASAAAAAAVGANFGGVTSFLLGLSPELGRSLRLDVLYPVGGFTRCLDSDNGFGYFPVCTLTPGVVYSSETGTPRPLYGGLFASRAGGEGYFYPAWVAAR